MDQANSDTQLPELNLRVESLTLTVVRPQTGDAIESKNSTGDSGLGSRKYLSENSAKCRIRVRLVSDAEVAWKVGNDDSSCSQIESKRWRNEHPATVAHTNDDGATEKETPLQYESTRTWCTATSQQISLDDLTISKLATGHLELQVLWGDSANPSPDSTEESENIIGTLTIPLKKILFGHSLHASIKPLILSDSAIAHGLLNADVKLEFFATPLLIFYVSAGMMISLRDCVVEDPKEEWIKCRVPMSEASEQILLKGPTNVEQANELDTELKQAVPWRVQCNLHLPQLDAEDYVLSLDNLGLRLHSEKIEHITEHENDEELNESHTLEGSESKTSTDSKESKKSDSSESKKGGEGKECDNSTALCDETARNNVHTWWSIGGNDSCSCSVFLSKKSVDAVRGALSKGSPCTVSIHASLKQQWEEELSSENEVDQEAAVAAAAASKGGKKGKNAGGPSAEELAEEKERLQEERRRLAVAPLMDTSVMIDLTPLLKVGEDVMNARQEMVNNAGMLSAESTSHHPRISVVVATYPCFNPVLTTLNAPEIQTPMFVSEDQYEEEYQGSNDEKYQLFGARHATWNQSGSNNLMNAALDDLEIEMCELVQDIKDGVGDEKKNVISEVAAEQLLKYVAQNTPEIYTRAHRLAIRLLRKHLNTQTDKGSDVFAVSESKSSRYDDDVNLSTASVSASISSCASSSSITEKRQVGKTLSQLYALILGKISTASDIERRANLAAIFHSENSNNEGSENGDAHQALTFAQSKHMNQKEELAKLERIASNSELTGDVNRAGKAWLDVIASTDETSILADLWLKYGAFNARQGNFALACVCFLECDQAYERAQVLERPLSSAKSRRAIKAQHANESKSNAEEKHQASSDKNKSHNSPRNAQTATSPASIETKIDALLYHVLTLIERDDVHAANERLIQHKRTQSTGGPHLSKSRKAVLGAAEILVLDLTNGDALGHPEVASSPGAQREALLQLTMLALSVGLPETAMLCLGLAVRAANSSSGGKNVPKRTMYSSGKLAALDNTANERFTLAIELLRARAKLIAGKAGAAMEVLQSSQTVLDKGMASKPNAWLYADFCNTCADACLARGGSSMRPDARKWLAVGLASIREAQETNCTHDPLSRGERLFPEIAFKFGEQSALDNEIRASRAVCLNATRNPTTEKDAWTWLGLGRACSRTGELKYASKALEKALTLDAQNAQAWAELALVLLLQGRGSQGEATSAIQKALRFGVRDAMILRDVAAACDTCGSELAKEAADVRARATALEIQLE